MIINYEYFYFLLYPITSLLLIASPALCSCIISACVLHTNFTEYYVAQCCLIHYNMLLHVASHSQLADYTHTRAYIYIYIYIYI
jgi:hypothetical protein